MAESQPLTCFLVAPFGNKAPQVSSGAVGHFELLRSAIKEVVKSFPDVPIILKRADEISNVTSIGQTFIGALCNADIVVAEISATMNPNIFYELGIRHALRRGVTIPIWQVGTSMPADLQGILGVEYEGSNPLASRDKFHQFIRQRLPAGTVDSPVYHVLPNLQVMQAEDVARLRARVVELEQLLRTARVDDATQVLVDDAEAFLARGEPRAALEKFSEAHRHSPGNIRIAFRYGQILSRVNRHDESIRVLGEGVRLSEAAGAPASVLYRELGMAYKRAGHSQVAVDWLRRAVSQDPSDSETHAIIGGVYKEALDLDPAIESYQRGFDCNTRSTYCLLNVIGLLLARDRTGDRIRITRLLRDADRLTAEAIASNQSDYWALYDRAHFYVYADRMPEALVCFEVALSLTPTTGEVESARKNLDLLADAGSRISGLADVLAKFEARSDELRRKQQDLP